MVLVWVPESIVVTIRDPGSGTQDTRSQITTMLSGTQQSGTRDLVPGTHWVPKSIAIQSGTRDLGTQVPESIVVPLLLVRLVIKLPLFYSSKVQGDKNLAEASFSRFSPARL